MIHWCLYMNNSFIWFIYLFIYLIQVNWIIDFNNVLLNYVGLFLVEKVDSALLLLEAFGCTRTPLNTNASRFANLVTVEFDSSKQLLAINFQVHLSYLLRYANHSLDTRNLLSVEIREFSTGNKGIFPPMIIKCPKCIVKFPERFLHLKINFRSDFFTYKRYCYIFGYIH